MKVLEIPIDGTTRKGTLEGVKRFLESDSFHQIVTVNPEFVLLSEKDAIFRQALLSADMRIADGIGIVFAGLAQGILVERFSGADLMGEILKMCQEKELAVFLALRKDGLSSLGEIKSALAKKYPLLAVSGQEFDTNREDTKPNLSDSSVLLCNFGAPKQEVFLSSVRKHPENVRLAMGVGGAFDYLTGKVPRAPKLIRKLGLEWLWRLFLQPRRLGRIWNAVIVFPLHLILATTKK